MSNDSRILEHPILGTLEHKPRVTFTFDDQTIEAFESDTIASALLAQGIRTLRVQEEAGTPRGIYCNIGHCFECRVTVDQVSGVRACLVEVTEGMVVESGRVLPSPLKKEQETEELPRTYAEYEKTLADYKEGNAK